MQVYAVSEKLEGGKIATKPGDLAKAALKSWDKEKARMAREEEARQAAREEEERGRQAVRGQKLQALLLEKLGLGLDITLDTEQAEIDGILFGLAGNNLAVFAKCAGCGGRSGGWSYINSLADVGRNLIEFKEYGICANCQEKAWEKAEAESEAKRQAEGEARRETMDIRIEPVRILTPLENLGQALVDYLASAGHEIPF